MKKMMAIAVLGVAFAVGCGGDGPTSPSQVPTSSVGTTVGQSAQPAPSPSPAAEQVPGLTAFIKDQACFVTNSTGLEQRVRFQVFFVPDPNNPMEGQKQVFDKYFTVPNGGVDVALTHDQELACGLYQFDCGRSPGLLAYKFQQVDDCCVEEATVEQKVEYGEWGECTKEEKGCFKSRTKTTTTTTTYVCTQEKKVDTKVETEKAECECKEECVPVWEESEKVTYTEWGACEPQRDGTCAKYRKKITEIWLTNSCTKETKLYKTNEEREFEKCECEVEQCEYKNAGQQLPTFSTSSKPEGPNYNDPEVACGYYGLTGYKLEPVNTPWISPGDFPVVIIKAGSSSSCDTNENTSWFGVEKGDALTASLCGDKQISHVIVCECPEEE